METIKELKEICQSHKRKKQTLGFWGYERHRDLSIYITKAILKLVGSKIKPNHISFFNILFGLLIVSLIALTENKLIFLLLLFLFYFSFLLDKVDGEIARYQKAITLRGVYLDEIYHLFVQNGLILVIGINRFLIAGKDTFLFFGIAGFFLFFLTRYINKIKYFIYASKYKSKKDKFLIKKDLGKFEKLFYDFLNIFPLKLCSLACRHDIFLVLVFVLSIFYFSTMEIWFWFLFFWLLLLVIYFLRFLFLNCIFVDRDIRLIEENKL